MWHLLLVTLLCGGPAVLAGKISIEDGCAKGPTYWCKNLVTAIQCGAWEHCMQTGWNTATQEDTCADCKEIVTILVRMAKESTFKKAIQNYLKHECAAFSLQTLIPRCQELVDTYYSLFITALEGQIQPDAVCAKFGLCQSDPLESKDIFGLLVQKMAEQIQLLQGEAFIMPNNKTQDNPKEELLFPWPWRYVLPQCWLCKNLVGRIESSLPKDAIGKSMAQLCRFAPGAAAGMCQCLMEKYTVTIVDAVLGKLGPNLICGMMLMCATEENCGPETPPLSLSGPADTCQACLALKTQLKATLKPNSSRAEMEAALLTACSNTFRRWEECKSFIDQHEPKLFLLLAKPWSAQRTCQELGACVAEKPFPGTTACAQGPTYWCSSLSTAEECKAVQHCQDHVWL
uniref:pulmonary surfactant-associated protein B n=1 Tax=Podarcis muralis TaxID=64176 RepID=UPI00109EF0E4|nr:pulmonary surfactant-associated protein B [Podarcis muralis]